MDSADFYRYASARDREYPLGYVSVPYYPPAGYDLPRRDVYWDGAERGVKYLDYSSLPATASSTGLDEEYMSNWARSMAQPKKAERRRDSDARYATEKVRGAVEQEWAWINIERDKLSEEIWEFERSKQKEMKKLMKARDSLLQALGRFSDNMIDRRMRSELESMLRGIFEEERVEAVINEQPQYANHSFINNTSFQASEPHTPQRSDRDIEINNLSNTGYANPNIRIRGDIISQTPDAYQRPLFNSSSQSFNGTRVNPINLASKQFAQTAEKPFERSQENASLPTFKQPAFNQQNQNNLTWAGQGFNVQNKMIKEPSTTSFQQANQNKKSFNVPNSTQLPPSSDNFMLSKPSFPEASSASKLTSEGERLIEASLKNPFPKIFNLEWQPLNVILFKGGSALSSDKIDQKVITKLITPQTAVPSPFPPSRLIAATLNALAEIPDRISHLRLDRTAWTASRQTFTMALFSEGAWTAVAVENAFPSLVNKNTGQMQLYCARSSNSGYEWPAVIEKGLAQLKGGYDKLSNLSIEECLTNFTGAPCQSYAFSKAESDKEFDDFLWQEIIRCLSMDFALVASDPLNDSSFACTLLAAYNITQEPAQNSARSSSSPRRIIKVRTPTTGKFFAPLKDLSLNNSQELSNLVGNPKIDSQVCYFDYDAFKSVYQTLSICFYTKNYLVSSFEGSDQNNPIMAAILRTVVGGVATSADQEYDCWKFKVEVEGVHYFSVSSPQVMNVQSENKVHSLILASLTPSTSILSLTPSSPLVSSPLPRGHYLLLCPSTGNKLSVYGPGRIERVEYPYRVEGGMREWVCRGIRNLAQMRAVQVGDSPLFECVGSLGDIYTYAYAVNGSEDEDIDMICSIEAMAGHDPIHPSSLTRHLPPAGGPLPLTLHPGEEFILILERTDPYSQCVYIQWILRDK